MLEPFHFTPLPQPNPLQQRTLHGLQHNVRLWPREIDQAQSAPFSLVLRRPHDPVHRALQVSAAQKLQRVRNIHDDGVPR